MKLTTFIYLVPFFMVLLWHLQRRQRQESASRSLLEENQRAGLTEPASLHPVIDPRKCMGCGSCASACPEGDVMGLIEGKALLVNPTHCIGHGACQRACPFDAITLVFGTQQRGVDIPFIDEHFETNMPGIFIAGELGGMGLIRNAVEQGRQALESLSRKAGGGSGGDDRLDVLIVGAGPAGFAASLGAQERGLHYRTIEQESLGGTVSHFPRGKLVMTAPVKLPLVGRVNFRETTKEALIDFWQAVEKRTGIDIHYRERLENVEPDAAGYRVTTSQGVYHTRTVLLAIGRRGTPRKLGVPGEEMSKVVYRLIDAEQYRGQRVLVVGGGDSALEAATSIAELPDTHVTLSYRSEAFSRAKEKNRERVQTAQSQGRLQVLFKSNVVRIGERQVELDSRGESLVLDNDAVIVSAGGVLPSGFLRDIGIEVETKHGTA